MNRNGKAFKILEKTYILMRNLNDRISEKSLDEWYKTSDYPKRIQEFKNYHKGERCFIIGNGPSLNVADLEMLSNEVTFACNKIYKIYDKTNWRPSYYVVDDRNYVKEDYYNIINTADPKIAGFIGVEYNKKIIEPYIASDRIIMKKKTILHNGYPEWNIDVDDYVCTGHTVIYVAIQLAVYMGFKEIYLLGVDCSYTSTFENGQKGTNYFYESNNQIVQMDANNMFLAFESAKRMMQETGVKIYNSTRGGKLETFDRVALDELFVKKE